MKAASLLPILGAIVAMALGVLPAAPGRAAAIPVPDCSGRQTPTTVRLTIQATGMRSSRGQLAATVYPDSTKRFLAKGGKLTRDRLPAVQGSTRACFWLTPGVFYAVSLYHDEDGDHDFDRTAVGLPAEGYGFSNDAPTRLGLPSLEAVRFKLPNADTTIRIRMTYPTKK